jgi:hypothetical protein
MLRVTKPPFTLHLSVWSWGILFQRKGLQGRSRPGRLWKLQNLREEFEYEVFLPVDICEQCCEATQSAFLMRQRLQVVEYVVLFGQVHFLSCTARLCFSALAERRIPVTHGLVCPWCIWPGLRGILHCVWLVSQCTRYGACCKCIGPVCLHGAWQPIFGGWSMRVYPTQWPKDTVHLYKNFAALCWK